MSELQTRLDHLVIVADTLAQGVAWCERTLGVTPGPGGEHPLMGTHNRLLRIATVDHPRAYLEIIAINPLADAASRAPGSRWFDMDQPALRERVARHGPQLAHFVANVTALEPAVAALAALGIDRGPALAASRPTERGLLRWQITVRPDGQRLFDGALPTLIEWGSTHPCGALPDSGLSLHQVAVTHPRHAQLAAAYTAIGLHGVAVSDGPANVSATLLTPLGSVRLESQGF